MALAARVLWAMTKEGRQLFLRKKVHPGDLTGGCSDLEITWLLYCAGAGAATGWAPTARAEGRVISFSILRC